MIRNDIPFHVHGDARDGARDLPPAAPPLLLPLFPGSTPANADPARSTALVRGRSPLMLACVETRGINTCPLPGPVGLFVAGVCLLALLQLHVRQAVSGKCYTAALGTPTDEPRREACPG